MTKKVSVIIPAYIPTENHLGYLDEAVESINRQTYKNVDTVVVFNGGFTKDYPSAHVVNLGFKTSATVARNIGASIKWNSDYLCFLDADDVFIEEKIQKQVEYMEQNQCDFLFTKTYDMSIDGSSIRLPTYKSDGISHDHIKTTLNTENILVNSSSMIKTSSFFAAGMYPPTNEYGVKADNHLNQKGNIYEDALFWLNSINKGFVFHKLDEPLLKYRCASSVER